MSNIDKRALREAAEKALPAMKRLLMMPNDELFDEALLNVDGDVDAANAFNLLTGPETVLALLDELEAKDKQIAELTEARDLFNSKMMGFAYRVEELEARTVKIPYLPDDCDRTEAHFKYQAALAAAGIQVIEGEQNNG